MVTRHHGWFAYLTVMIKAGVGLCVHGLLQSRDSHESNDVICSKSY